MMDLFFSFNTKQELIVVDGQTYTHEIGALLKCIIDTDWMMLLHQVEQWAQNGTPAAFWGKHIDSLLQSLQCHPLIRKLLAEMSDKKIVVQEIEKLIETQKALKHVCETLVDEHRDEYAIRLYELFHEEITQETQLWLSRMEEVRTSSDGKTLQLADQLQQDFPVIFSTKNLQTIAFRELRFICTNHFYIRKCVNCRNFFWTKSTTKMYCNRPVPLRKTNCSQYGPRRKRQMEKRPAYKLYWNQRDRMLSQALHRNDHSVFYTWLKETAPYKERARRGDISLEEMLHILNEIERHLYPSLSSKTQKLLSSEG